MSTESPPKNIAEADAATDRIDGVVIGLLMGLAHGQPEVVYPANPNEKATLARSLTAIRESDIGKEVALLFEGGDPGKPLLVGLIHQPEITGEAIEQQPSVGNFQMDDAEDNLNLSIDGETVRLKAQDSISLSCGRASITLTKAGKIIIKGAYVSTRSSGVNRIKGGSVQIN